MLNFDITFNSKKTLCIKFSESLNGKECAKLNGKIIKWVDHIKHLGNFLDPTLSDKLDIRSKISAFIGYVNKVKANFGYLRMYVLCKLFKIIVAHFIALRCGRLTLFRGGGLAPLKLI